MPHTSKNKNKSVWQNVPTPAFSVAGVLGLRNTRFLELMSEHIALFKETTPPHHG